MSAGVFIDFRDANGNAWCWLLTGDRAAAEQRAAKRVSRFAEEGFHVSFKVREA